MKKNLFITLVSLLLITSHSSAPIQAADGIMNLSISPPIFEIVIKPGETVTQTFSLTNSSTPIDILAKLTDYEDGSPTLDASSDEWVKIDPRDTSFTLPSNSKKEVTLTLSPPENINEGEYNKVLLYSTSPASVIEGTGSHIIGHIGSIILITVSKTGAISHLAKISKFTLPPIMDSFSPLTAIIEAENIGTGRIRPSGQVLVAGPVGKATYSVIPETIFAGSKKILLTDVSKNEKNQSYSVFLPGFYIGKYDVSVTLNPGSSRSKVIQTRSIIALPWKALLIISAIITTSILVLKSRKKSSAMKPLPKS